jgi:hypothetical protein
MKEEWQRRARPRDTPALQEVFVIKLNQSDINLKEVYQ